MSELDEIMRKMEVEEDARLNAREPVEFSSVFDPVRHVAKLLSEVKENLGSFVGAGYNWSDCFAVSFLPVKPAGLSGPLLARYAVYWVLRNRGFPHYLAANFFEPKSRAIVVKVLDDEVKAVDVSLGVPAKELKPVSESDRFEVVDATRYLASKEILKACGNLEGKVAFARSVHDLAYLVASSFVMSSSGKDVSKVLLDPFVGFEEGFWYSVLANGEGVKDNSLECVRRFLNAYGKRNKAFTSSFSGLNNLDLNTSYSNLVLNFVQRLWESQGLVMNLRPKNADAAKIDDFVRNIPELVKSAWVRDDSRREICLTDRVVAVRALANEGRYFHGGSTDSMPLFVSHGEVDNISDKIHVIDDFNGAGWYYHRDEVYLLKRTENVDPQKVFEIAHAIFGSHVEVLKRGVIEREAAVKALTDLGVSGEAIRVAVRNYKDVAALGLPSIADTIKSKDDKTFVVDAVLLAKDRFGIVSALGIDDFKSKPYFLDHFLNNLISGFWVTRSTPRAEDNFLSLADNFKGRVYRANSVNENSVRFYNLDDDISKIPLRNAVRVERVKPEDFILCDGDKVTIKNEYGSSFGKGVVKSRLEKFGWYKVEVDNCLMDLPAYVMKYDGDVGKISVERKNLYLAQREMLSKFVDEVRNLEVPDLVKVCRVFVGLNSMGLSPVDSLRGLVHSDYWQDSVREMLL
jgi:hypothetical protein